jgi:KaiC/GvpD/RAD55 family RecA-like ATPase
MAPNEEAPGRNGGSTEQIDSTEHHSAYSSRLQAPPKARAKRRSHLRVAGPQEAVLAATRELVGAVIMYDSIPLDGLDSLAPPDPRLASVLRAAVARRAAGEPVTPALLSETTGVPADELAALAASAPPPAAVPQLVAVLRREQARQRAAEVLAEAQAALAAGDTASLAGYASVLSDLAAEALSPDPLARARDVTGLVDWYQLFAEEEEESEWLAEPCLARGRSHALFAAAKSGKSLLTLWVAYCLAVGRAPLQHFFELPQEPVRVLYLDWEQSPNDLRERLRDFGATPEQLSNLFYYLLPDIPALDSPEGAAALQGLIDAHKPDLVVIDTLSRAVTGEENSADTYRNYYTHAGQVLKRARVTSIRLDHAGKDEARGQRGSSGKNDDVDIVWQLSPAEGGWELIATHTRPIWVPKQAVKVQLDLGGEVTAIRLAQRLDPPGTELGLARLRAAGVQPGTPVTEALRQLRAATGQGARKAVLLAALRRLAEDVR